jgi:hypothetical protein
MFTVNVRLCLALLLSLVSWVVLAPRATTVKAAQVAAYKLVILQGRSDAFDETTDQQFIQFSRDGWELIQIVDHHGFYYAVLKK